MAGGKAWPEPEKWHTPKIHWAWAIIDGSVTELPAANDITNVENNNKRSYTI